METKVTWPLDTLRTKKPKISERYSVLLTGSLGTGVIFWPKDGKDNIV